MRRSGLLNDDGILVLKFQGAPPGGLREDCAGCCRKSLRRRRLIFYADASKYSSGGHFFIVGIGKTTGGSVVFAGPGGVHEVARRVWRRSQLG